MSMDGTFELLFPFAQYEVERILGKLPSGRAVSWLSRSKETGRQVVIKEVSLADSVGHEAWLERQWSGWARIHEIRTGKANAIYIRDYVEGERLGRFRESLPVYAALKQLADICATLAPLHSMGIAHARIKPNNIFIDSAGQAIMTDPTFDPTQAASRPDEEETADAGIAFDPYYISPEQIRGVAATTASDVYSLGCILFELITGKPPFRNVMPLMICYQHAMNPPPSFESLGVHADREVESLIMRMLAKSPDKRPQTVEVLLDELEPLMDPAFSGAAMTGTFTFTPEQLGSVAQKPDEPKPEPLPPDPQADVSTDVDELPAEPRRLTAPVKEPTGTLVISRRELKKLIERADNKTYQPGDTPVLDPDERLPIPLVRPSPAPSTKTLDKATTALMPQQAAAPAASDAPTSRMRPVREREEPLPPKSSPVVVENPPTAANPKARPTRRTIETVLWIYSIFVTIALLAAIAFIIHLLATSA
jgi:serine/threonine protein kinase